VFILERYCSLEFFAAVPEAISNAYSDKDILKETIILKSSANFFFFFVFGSHC
jgi:hypothetical protein